MHLVVTMYMHFIIIFSTDFQVLTVSAAVANTQNTCMLSKGKS